MFTLPKLPYNNKSAKKQNIRFYGLNYSDERYEGNLAETKQISAKRFPYITTTNDDKKESYSDVDTLSARNDLITFSDGTMSYAGIRLDGFSTSQKQLAQVGGQLVIYPDKKIVDLANPYKCFLYNLSSADNPTEISAEKFLPSLSGLPYSPIGAYLFNRTGTYGNYSYYVRITQGDIFDTTLWTVTLPTGVTLDKGAMVAYLKTHQSILCKIILNRDNSTEEGYPFSLKYESSQWNLYANGTKIADNVGCGGGSPSANDTISITLVGANPVKKENINVADYGLKYDVGFDCAVVLEPSLQYRIMYEEIKTEEFQYSNIDGSGNPLKINGIDATKYQLNLSKCIYLGDIIDKSDAFDTVSLNESVISSAFSADGVLDNLIQDKGFMIKYVSNWKLFRISGGESELYTFNTAPITYTTSAESIANFYVKVTLSYSDFSNVKANDVIVIGTDKNQYKVIDVYDKRSIYAEKSKTYTANSGTVTQTTVFKINDEKSALLDYICAWDNRLWGVSTKNQTIYSSALGEPHILSDYSGKSTDSFAVAVEDADIFTAAYAYADSVMFFKENRIYRMFGNYPSDYQLTSYKTEGVKYGCDKSLCIVNNTLFFVGLHGVYVFNGGTPKKISTSLGNGVITEAVGGTDGERYILSCKYDGESKTFIYEPKHDMWLHLNDVKMTDITYSNGVIYYLCNNGDVYRLNGGDDVSEWIAQFVPFYETLEGKKTYSKIIIRAELAKNANLNVEVRTDNGLWKSVARIVGTGKEIPQSIRLPIARCDKFELRLSGKGKCTIMSILREFSVGSDV